MSVSGFREGTKFRDSGNSGYSRLMASSDAETLDAALSKVFEGTRNTKASWFALTRGERLYEPGDPADTLYLLRSGRLGVFRNDSTGQPQFVGVIKPGDPVGEMAMLAGQNHLSQVVALRDSELIALPRSAFFEAARDEPQLMSALGQVMLARAEDNHGPGNPASVFGFISGRSEPIRSLVERLARAVEAQGRTCLVIDQSALSSASEWFSKVEDSHDYVFYVAENDQAGWAGLCARQVDRLFVVGECEGAIRLPVPLSQWEDMAHPLTDLILTRPLHQAWPRATKNWLDSLTPSRWFHVVEGLSSDIDRMARVITGTSVGIVLSGGGARAYAHIGALRALKEAGVPIDFVGGASMGAVIAAGPALGWSEAELESAIHAGFVHANPLDDIAFPIIALTHSRKVSRLMQEAYGDVQIENLLLPFFAVSTNLTAGRVEVHRKGLLRQALRASISLPGVMPPVVSNGQVLVDGAVLRNFPSDVMRRFNSGPIVGVDVSQTRGVDAKALEDPPSWWQWLVTGQWRKGPPIVSILMRSATLSTAAELMQARADTDLLILPRPDGVDIRDWKAYAPAVAAGYDAAKAELESLHGPVTDLLRGKPKT